jgi:hypothetical protein
MGKNERGAETTTTRNGWRGNTNAETTTTRNGWRAKKKVAKKCEEDEKKKQGEE